MNTRSSNHTGRFPRSLEEAFGPHTSHHITEDEPPMPAADVVVVVTCTVAAVVLLGLVLFGVIT